MSDVTDAQYFGSKDPQVSALHSLPFDQREAAAEALDAKGFTIDRQIDIWAWEPSLVMKERAIYYGLKVVPAAAFPSSTVPKFIKVTYDAADYPPFIIGEPPPVPAPVSPVGPYIGNGEYAANITACERADGSLVFQNGIAYPNVAGDGKTYVFHAVKMWGAWSLNWTVQ